MHAPGRSDRDQCTSVPPPFHTLVRARNGGRSVTRAPAPYMVVSLRTALTSTRVSRLSVKCGAHDGQTAPHCAWFTRPTHETEISAQTHSHTTKGYGRRGDEPTPPRVPPDTHPVVHAVRPRHPTTDLGDQLAAAGAVASMPSRKPGLLTTVASGHAAAMLPCHPHLPQCDFCRDGRGIAR